MPSNILKNDRVTWLKGHDFSCHIKPENKLQPVRLVLLGAPGVGKGTQAELLHDRFGASPFSTGDVFRAAKAIPDSERTPAMSAALEHMRRGELVPDGTVLEVVQERSDYLQCPGGFLLDGFPRTVAQAEGLDELLASLRMKLDAVVNFVLPHDEIVSRLSGRRTCVGCAAVFHVTARPPKVADVCDHCGADLVQREDDRMESVNVRMAAYESATAPLTDYYRKRRLLVSIDAHGQPEEIFNRTLSHLSIKR
jgi:adenylate kinase